MKPENGGGNDHTEQLEELRKSHYSDPDKDPGCTTIEGTSVSRQLQLPVGKELAFEIVEGPKKGVKFFLPKGNVIIGRTSEADLSIDDDKIRRKHALVEAFGSDQIFISDLASTNGTFLNGMRVRSIKMKDGDEIKFGATVMKFICKDI